MIVRNIKNEDIELLLKSARCKEFQFGSEKALCNLNFKLDCKEVVLKLYL